MTSDDVTRAEPMIDWIGNTPVEHGERGDMDPTHPLACLCGEPDYLVCPHFEDGIQSFTVRARDVPGVIPCCAGRSTTPHARTAMVPAEAGWECPTCEEYVGLA